MDGKERATVWNALHQALNQKTSPKDQSKNTDGYLLENWKNLKLHQKEEVV
jgi:hypothetical protein